MRFTSRLVVTLSFVAASLTLAAQQPSPAEALFQKGLMLERAEGNLTQAVVLYERVVAEYPKDAVVVPQALFHLARVYEKTDAQRATRMWTRIATEFGTTQYADEARRKLASEQAREAGPFKTRSLDGVMTGQGLNPGGGVEYELSPNGRMVAWVKRGSAGEGVLIRDLDNGNDRTAFGEAGYDVENVDWSADSQRVSFLVMAAGTVNADHPQQDLRVFTVANGQLRSLAKGEGVFRGPGYYWSPDAQRIVIRLGRFGSTPSALQIVNATSGESRIVPGETWDHLSWSPDGRELVYRTANPDHFDDFWILSAETGQVRPLAVPIKVSSASDRLNIAQLLAKNHPWVQPSQILFRQAKPQGGTFYLVPTNGGPAKPTCVNPANVCGEVTPDGAFQLEFDSSQRVILRDLVGGGERRITGGFGVEESPMLSPDGKLLAFVSNSDGKWGLYVVPLDRTPVAAPVRLANLDERPSSDARAVSWGRDGRLIINVTYGDTNVYRINMDSTGHATSPAGRLTQDSASSYSPSVSPDGTRIAYRFDTGARSGIAVMTADGASERPVIENSGAQHLEWLSGDEVLFNNRPTGSGPSAETVAALNLRTGTVRPFADYANGFAWQYVPSRNEVVYIQGTTSPTAQLSFSATTPANAVVQTVPTGTSRTFHSRSLKDGTDRVIATVDGLLSRLFSFRVSPDGQWIAYGRWNGTGSNRKLDMHLMTIDGRNDRVLLTSPGSGNFDIDGYPYDWSPDGRFLIYDEFPGQLRVVDVQSGSNWPISEAVDADKVVWRYAQWSPSGSFVVIARGGWRNEFRLFEGVTYDAVVKLMNAGKK